MKKAGIKLGIVIVAMGLSASVWAVDQPAGTPSFSGAAGAGAQTGGQGGPGGSGGPGGHGGMGGNTAGGQGSHPCHAIEEACKSAGFVKGGAGEGKGIWKNCIMPTLSGQAVPGVNVSAADVQACKMKKPEHGHGTH